MLTSASRAASRVFANRSSPVVGSMATQVRSYHENIVEHYENPRNVGSLDKDDDSVGTVSGLFSYVPPIFRIVSTYKFISYLSLDTLGNFLVVYFCLDLLPENTLMAMM
jgi:hypothetical protein